VRIEQAKGVLAERFALDVDAAFELLRSAARNSQTKLHELAEHVVREQPTPPPITTAFARQSRLRAAGIRERTSIIREHARQMRERMERTIAELESSSAWLEGGKSNGIAARADPLEGPPGGGDVAPQSSGAAHLLD
jgi:hypothetical protein